MGSAGGMVLDTPILHFKFKLAFRLCRMECMIVTYRVLRCTGIARMTNSSVVSVLSSCTEASCVHPDVVAMKFAHSGSVVTFARERRRLAIAFAFGPRWQKKRGRA